MPTSIERSLSTLPTTLLANNAPKLRRAYYNVTFLHCFVVYLEAHAWANPVLWEGRAFFNYTQSDIDQSKGAYFSGVKGTQGPSHYFQFLGKSLAPTPLWAKVVQEQPVHALIDNSSVFTPGQNPPQFGFRRSELLAQPFQGGDRTGFDATLESGTTAFHFSVQTDAKQSLNLAHEYQVVFIETPDGTHIFDLQTGTPFNTTVSSPDAARVLRIRAHDSSVLFQTPFQDNVWHNFAVVVDWDNLTLKVLYSVDGAHLQAVTNAQANKGATKGPDGQGEFHFGVLKLPLINPSDSPAQQADVVHHGKQEGSTEALIYSGMFVEGTQDGVSIGCNQTTPVGK
ncbi:hypothetical protein BJV78DRAFT_1275556 [Lactifluus subvellereus]|nr:hypothetical protein BJV78DRAFT_1275556 [Lactifluus subvellereus]